MGERFGDFEVVGVLCGDEARALGLDPDGEWRRCVCRCAHETAPHGSFVVRRRVLEKPKRATLLNCGAGSRNPYARETHPLNYVYRALHGVEQRCTNQNRADHRNYGGRPDRPITVHPRYSLRAQTEATGSARAAVDNLIADIGERPHPTMTLDRCDNDRGYEPGNLRWATRKTQARNLRTTPRVGDAALVDLAEERGLKPSTVHARRRAGHDVETALSGAWLPERAARMAANRSFLRDEIAAGRLWVSADGRRVIGFGPSGPVDYVVRKAAAGHCAFKYAGRDRLAHVAVALQHLEEPPDPGMVVVHLNGDAGDNRVENLAYGFPAARSRLTAGADPADLGFVRRPRDLSPIADVEARLAAARPRPAPIMPPAESVLRFGSTRAALEARLAGLSGEVAALLGPEAPHAALWRAILAAPGNAVAFDAPSGSPTILTVCNGRTFRRDVLALARRLVAEDGPRPPQDSLFLARFPEDLEACGVALDGVPHRGRAIEEPARNALRTLAANGPAAGSTILRSLQAVAPALGARLLPDPETGRWRHPLHVPAGSGKADLHFACRCGAPIPTPFAAGDVTREGRGDPTCGACRHLISRANGGRGERDARPAAL